MTPQDHFIVASVVPRDRISDLRGLLATMTVPGFPGAADPANAILPFGRFETIHFARLTVLEDNTLGDRAVYIDAFLAAKGALSPDGVFPEAGAETARRALASIDPEIAEAKLDLSAVYKPSTWPDLKIKRR